MKGRGFLPVKYQLLNTLHSGSVRCLMYNAIMSKYELDIVNTFEGVLA